MLSRMKFRVPALALALILVAPLAACKSEEGVGVMGRPGWSKTETGALIGAGAGAATGAAIAGEGDRTKGALIGGAAGAVLGGAAGRELENRDVRKQKEQQQQQQQQYQGY